MKQSLKTNKLIESETSPIDLGKIINDLLKHKQFYFKLLPLASVLIVLIAMSLPNYYDCEIKLSPELSTVNKGNTLSYLARNFGINLDDALGNSTEALFPTLYPQLIRGIDFKASLFNVPVTIEGDEEKGVPSQQMSYYDYLDKHQKTPWWNSAVVSIINFIKGFFIQVDNNNPEINPFRLSLRQSEISKIINEKIVCDVDVKSMIITIKVTDQNPVVCATMADTVAKRLQRFILEYRTNKSRIEFDYYKKITEEAKSRYDKAQNLYAEFVDANQDIVLEKVRQKKNELENEAQIQFSIYVGYLKQMQRAEAAIQENTPAFVIIQSATVPALKAGPKKPRICIILFVMVFMVASFYILYKEGDLKPLLGL